MKTIPLYQNDTYLFKLNAQIINYGQDDKGVYILLDQTIFYPQGGGQPFDQGFIKGDGFDCQVHEVRFIDGDIRHYFLGTPLENTIGQNVSCVLDKERRLYHARYHTAAHLLGNVVEILYPALKAIKGHSFPNEAYVDFQSDGDGLDSELIQLKLNQAIQDKLDIIAFECDVENFEKQYYELPYKVPGNKSFRAVQIGNYLPVPCGGTHLKNTIEIKDVIIGKMKQKKDNIRITYKVS